MLTALLDLEEPSILDAFPRSRFIRADNAMYKPVLDTSIAVGISRR
jgi:phosphonate transport system substrate-binding protein